MKKVLVLFLFCATPIVAFFAQPLDSVIVTGKIEGFSDDLGELFVQVFVDDIVLDDQVTYLAAVSDDGHFKLKALLYVQQTFYIRFGKQAVTVFAKPGDSLYLSFPAFAFMSEAEDTLSEDYVAFGGDGQDMNTLIAAYVSYEHHLRNSFFEDMSKPENWECSRNKQLVGYHREERLVMLKQFLEVHQHVPEAFRRWAEAGIEFDYINTLLLPHDFNHKTPLPCPPEWYNFYQKAPIDKLDVAMTDFDTYLNYLGAYLRKRFFYGKDLKSAIVQAPFIEFLVDNTCGLTQELLLTHRYAWASQTPENKRIFEPLLPRFFELVKHERCRELIRKSYGLTPQSALPSDFLVKLESIQVADSVKNVLPHLLEKHKEKVIVLDFWATWCAPCLGEFQRFYPVFVPKFKEEEVTFIFLAGKSSKEAWQRTVNELKFKGEHYLLTSDQDSVLKNLFQISGIPHHVLIDRDGNVVDSNFEVKEEAIQRLLGK